MSDSRRYVFHGDQRTPVDSPPYAYNKHEPYVAPTELIRTVNLAIHLRRPLLLEGEAGCGKTRLARAIAYELGLPLYVWNIKSTSKAQEGLYSYDAILRLHDVQIRQMAKYGQTEANKLTNEAAELRDPADPKAYRRLGPLGKAFALPDCPDHPAVVLIDEIDKADIDFPNDLLTVLDDPWEFEIPETGERIAAHIEHKPIVIITSNKEKGNLPFPFLRRCLYYLVNFPDEKSLKKIVEEHYQAREVNPAVDLIESATQRFLAVRNEGNLRKRPGTSEFLDWMEALQSFDSVPYPPSELDNEDSALPYPELLFKLRQDLQD